MPDIPYVAPEKARIREGTIVRWGHYQWRYLSGFWRPWIQMGAVEGPFGFPDDVTNALLTLVVLQWRESRSGPQVEEPS